MTGKKKILFVTGSFNLGGGERQILYLLKLINREKFVPVLFALSDSGPLKKEIPSDVEFYFNHSTKKWKIPRLLNLLKIIKNVKPDLIYSNLALANIQLGIIKILLNLSIFREIKYIISVVNNIDHYNPFVKKMCYFLYPKFDLILACASGIKEQLSNSTKISSEKIGLLYNAVDVDFIIKRSKENVDCNLFNNNYPIVITVASLIPQKAIHDLIYAMHLINRKRNCNLVIVGDGVLRKYLEKLVEELDLINKVIFLGYQTNSNKFVKQADVFALTSHFEGLATVLLEAAVLEIPIVATIAPFGTVDIIQNNSMGILVPVGNKNAIAQGIIELLDNKSRAALLAKNLKKDVIEKFSIHSLIDKFENYVLNKSII